MAGSAHLELIGDATTSLPLESGKEGIARFRFRAKDQLGGADLRFEATGGGETVAETFGALQRGDEQCRLIHRSAHLGRLEEGHQGPAKPEPHAQGDRDDHPAAEEVAALRLLRARANILNGAVESGFRTGHE